MRAVMLAIAAAGCLAGTVIGWPTSAQSNVWFRSDFENPGPANRYEFAYFYGAAGECQGCNGAGRSKFWSFRHLPNGDHDGSGAAHLVRHAGADQYTMGWAAGRLGRSFRLGDHYYMRLRVRLDDAFRFEPATEGCFASSGPSPCTGHGQNKFLMMGTTGSPQSRVLILLQRPMGNLGCTLGARTPNPGVRTGPRDFALRGGDWEANDLRYRYGSFSVHTNIGDTADGCVGPVIATYGNNPVQPMSPRGVASPDGWYHLQIYVKSGRRGEAEYKIWANNNQFAAPTYAASGFELGVAGWQEGFTIGGQTTGALAADAGYRLGAIEIGGDFDPAWFPGEKRPVGGPSGSAR